MRAAIDKNMAVKQGAVAPAQALTYLKTVLCFQNWIKVSSACS